MSYFAPAKGERTVKPVETPVSDVKQVAPPRSNGPEIVSTLGAGLLITGNIVSTGGVQVFGHVVGDIHAAHLVVGKGAHIEGNVRAQDVVIDGTFKGTIHGNVVKLQSTAAVDGEIYNRSLAIDQNANFEGVARRLTQAVEAPTEDQLVVKPATPALVPEQPPTTAYAYSNGASHLNGYVSGDLPNGQASNY